MNIYSIGLSVEYMLEFIDMPYNIVIMLQITILNVYLMYIYKKNWHTNQSAKIPTHDQLARMLEHRS